MSGNSHQEQWDQILMTTAGNCSCHRCLGQDISVFSSLPLWADVFHLYMRFNPSSAAVREGTAWVFSGIWKFCWEMNPKMIKWNIWWASRRGRMEPWCLLKIFTQLLNYTSHGNRTDSGSPELSEAASICTILCKIASLFSCLLLNTLRFTCKSLKSIEGWLI